jgi:hypothetical protein
MSTIFVRDGRIFTSPNSATLPEIPDPDERVWGTSSPAQPLKTAWYNPVYPYLPWIPTNFSFTGIVFGRLVGQRHLVITDDMWTLPPDVKVSWIRLENALVDICDNFQVQVPLPSGSREYFTLPQIYGYRLRHEQEDVAYQAATKSIQAFLPLVARLAYSITIFDKELDSDIPNWVVSLLSRDVNPDWLQALRDSAVGTFSAKHKRAGVFINAHTFQDIEYISHAIRAHVPVWICWGYYATFLPDHPAVRPYRPTPEQLLAITPLLGRNPTSTPPAPEHWQRYFERQVDRHRRREKEETLQDRQKRLDREKSHGSCPLPGHSSRTVVYQWEKNDDGFRVRTRVVRAHVRDMWDEYSDSQKRYNSFDDEWDVCTEFGTSVEPEDDDIVMLPATDPAPEPISWADDLAAAYTQEASEPTPGVLQHQDSLKDVLVNKYGFAFKPTCVSRAPSNWGKTQRLLLHQDESVDELYHHSVEQYVTSLLAGGIDPPVRHLNDLSSVSIDAITRKERMIEVTTTTINGKIWYTVSPRYLATNPHNWHLMIQDAAVVLELWRRGLGLDGRSMAQYLLARGIPFSTRIYCMNPRPLRPLQCIGLGLRIKGYQPDALDYQGYEIRRDAFLKTARGRAALLYGGIVWRLAKDVVREEDVLSGPTEQVNATGHALHGEKGDLWDDRLSNQELDLICGVYRVCTGTPSLLLPLLALKFHSRSKGSYHSDPRADVRSVVVAQSVGVGQGRVGCGVLDVGV